MFVGLYLLGKKGGGEKKGGTKRERELPRVARKKSSNIMPCYIAGTRWWTADGRRGVDRKGLDGGRDRTVGFLILVKNFLVLIKKDFLFQYRNKRS